MDELQLLNHLQTIIIKLENNEELNDYEYKLFTIVLLSAAIGIIKQSLNYVLKLLGDEKGQEK